MKRIQFADLPAARALRNAEMARVNGGGLFDTLKTINRVRTLGCAAVKKLFPSLAKTKVYKVLCFGA
jgi:hypothetical protein